MSEMMDRVARAIEAAEVGYHLRLTRMDDNGSEYTLSYEDGETLKFDGTDTAYKHIANKKRMKAARAAIVSQREPTEAMIEAAMAHTSTASTTRCDRRSALQSRDIGKP